MKRTLFTVATTASLVTLSACSLFGGSATPADDVSSSSMSSASSIVETQNVSYEGTLQQMGASIFMEGTHKLILDDGRFILLTSEEGIDLDQYLNKQVQVLGAIRPTVEAGGMIMRVQQVTSMETASSEESSASSKKMCGGIAAFPCASDETCVDDPSDSCDPANGGADCGGMCVPASSSSSSSSSKVSSSSSSANSSSSKISSAISSSSLPSSSSLSSLSSSSVAFEASTELTDKAATMAKDKMDGALWTQKYCGKTAGFCFPVHKNWYFMSFGASAGALWHIEVGPQALNNIGDGPLSVNVLAGTVESVGGKDGVVSANGGSVVGYKNWLDGKRIEVRAPASLQAAVSYITANITASN